MNHISYIEHWSMSTMIVELSQQVIKSELINCNKKRVI